MKLRFLLAGSRGHLPGGQQSREFGWRGMGIF